MITPALHLGKSLDVILCFAELALKILDKNKLLASNCIINYRLPIVKYIIYVK